MGKDEIFLEVRDRLEIADALYRFGAGIDFNRTDLLESAFATDAVVDFGPAARKAGLDFPLLTGRQMIVQVLTSTVGLLDTTHSVTNPRIQITDDTAKLYAIVEAQHLPPHNHSRHFLMKNQYDVNLICSGESWVINQMAVDNVWFTGEPNILIGKG
jgi:hypothetical protein